MTSTALSPTPSTAATSRWPRPGCWPGPNEPRRRVRRLRRRVRRPRRRRLGPTRTSARSSTSGSSWSTTSPHPTTPSGGSTPPTPSAASAHTELFGSADDAAIIRAAIEALDTPDPEDCPEGPRSRQQRHYDIAIDIFRRALADQLGDDPATATAAPTSSSTPPPPPSSWPTPTKPTRPRDLDADPLVDLLAPYRDHAAGDRFLRRPLPATPTAPPPASAVAAIMLCSGWVRRIIRDPRTGNVLDVGRAQRRFGPRARRALAIRDGGCVFPGCDRKPKWCDAHHLQPWEDGGPTDLDNGALLCRRHHNLDPPRRTGAYAETPPPASSPPPPPTAANSPEDPSQTR